MKLLPKKFAGEGELLPSKLQPGKLVTGIGALAATCLAYEAMVRFWIDSLNMVPEAAWAMAGVFELLLVGFALQARDAVRNDQPAIAQEALTVLFSLLSGIFAAMHEAELGHGPGPVAIRLLIPLAAALAWHYLLRSDRLEATGSSWSELMAQRAAGRARKKAARVERRKHVRMEASMHAAQTMVRAQAAAVTSPNARNRRAVDRAIKMRLKTERAARQILTPAEVDDQVDAWVNVVRAQAGGVRAVSQIETVDVAASAGDALELKKIMNDESRIAELAASNFAKSLRNVHADTANGRAPVHGIHLVQGAVQGVQGVQGAVPEDNFTDVHDVHDRPNGEPPGSTETAWTAPTLSTPSKVSTTNSTESKAMDLVDSVDSTSLDTVYADVQGVHDEFHAVHDRPNPDSTLSTTSTLVPEEMPAGPAVHGGPVHGIHAVQGAVHEDNFTDVHDVQGVHESTPPATQAGFHAVHDRPSQDSTESKVSTPASKASTMLADKRPAELVVHGPVQGPVFVDSPEGVQSVQGVHAAAVHDVQGVHERPRVESTMSTMSTQPSPAPGPEPSKVSKVSTPDSTVSTRTPTPGSAETGRRRLVNGRLAPDLEEEIYRLDDAGATPAEIVEELGVSRSTVYNKLKARTPAGSVVPMHLRERA